MTTRVIPDIILGPTTGVARRELPFKVFANLALRVNLRHRIRVPALQDGKVTVYGIFVL